MSCRICTLKYRDGEKGRQCFRICADGKHAVCESCKDQILSGVEPKCPVCRRLLNPKSVELVRLGTDDDEEEDATGDVKMKKEIKEKTKAPPAIILLIDQSGSMSEPSADLAGAPLRIEMAVHIAKMVLAFCKKLGLACFVYTFSNELTGLEVSEKTATERVNKDLEALRPDGRTNLGAALGALAARHPKHDKCILIHDGEPTDSWAGPLSLWDERQLHVIAFSRAVDRNLLSAAAQSGLHTVSYVKDIRSLAGYLVPIFICAVNDLQSGQLSAQDETCRRRYVELLEPQVGGKSDKATLQDLLDHLKPYCASSEYARALQVDTKDPEWKDLKTEPAHSRIAYSFLNTDNWESFGCYYLICILHAHKHRLPCNAFDPSLRFYRTEDYNKVFAQLETIPDTIPFSAFLAEEAEREARSRAAERVVSRAWSSADSYSGYNDRDNDGCIEPKAWIRLSGGAVTQMKNLRPGDRLACGQVVKWIVRISALNGKHPIKLFEGLTPSHPIRCPATGQWILAKDNKQARRRSVTHGVVYDVALEGPCTAKSVIVVNGIEAAVFGMPVPGMVHPYYGTQLILDDLAAHAPAGGFVDVSATKFKYTHGWVSSLF